MNKVLDKLRDSLNKNEFKKFLMGIDDYRIPSREGEFSDLATALFSGVYEYYRLYPDKKINILFEQEIIKMLNGNNFETMCAFSHCWRQIICEERKTAPFVLSNQCIVDIKNSILNKKDILSKYKEYDEFGASLENGAYQYAQNIDKIIENEYGRRIL